MRFKNDSKIALYTVITGAYDSLPVIEPEKGVKYFLFTDNPQLPIPSFWNKVLLESPLDLGSCRLSRLPKLRPHFYLPPHDVSIYMDANLELLHPIREFALKCVHELPIAVHPHPKRTCIYTEGVKCIHWKIDEKHIIDAQLNRYLREGYPQNYGLAENSFIIRRNVEEVNRFNDLWYLEYSNGSERDQLSFMYCIWKTGLRPYYIWHNARINAYYKRHEHLMRRRHKVARKHSHYNGAFHDLKGLAATLSNNIEVVFVNLQSQDPVDVFASCGKVTRLWFADFGRRNKLKRNDMIRTIRRRYPNIVIENNYKLEAKHVDNQSIDLVYIDSPDNYSRMKRYIKRWRSKIKAGGSISGRSYNNKHQSVVRAIYETLGHPECVSADGSWLVNIPKGTFGIVTVCSLDDLDAYEFSIDSWLENAQTNEVVIFTDTPEFEERAKPRERVHFILPAFTQSPQDLAMSPVIRQIEALKMYYSMTLHPYFAYLDCNCWVKSDFREIFQSMHQQQIAATASLGLDGGSASRPKRNVIFFRHHPELKEFLRVWKERETLCLVRTQDICQDSDSFSQIICEAFDGLHSFQASVISHHIYNSEHENDDVWLERIRRHQPKIIHFKPRRFLNENLRNSAFSVLAKPNQVLVDAG